MSSDTLEKLDALGAAPTCTIDQLLRMRARRTPDATFLRSGQRTWSYREALDEAEAFGLWASKALSWPEAITPRVVSFLPNRTETIWVWFGSLLFGAVYVSLNRSHRGALLADTIRRSEARILATDLEGLEELPDLAGTDIEMIVLTDEIPVDFDLGGIPCLGWQQIRSASGELARPDWRPSDMAQLVFTSGSTGRSKAVMLSHTQMVRGAGRVSDTLEIGPEDVFHTWVPLFHIGGMVDAVLPMVIGGGGVALYPTFSLSRFWDEVKESDSTIFGGFENILRLLESLPARPDDVDCSLRAAVVGGAPPDLRAGFEARFGVKLHDTYGMTEAEPIAVQTRDSPPDSVGRPTADFDVAIVDADEEHLGADEVGEIVIRPRVPDVMFRGYEDDEAATLGAIRNLWFHTGDLGYLDAAGYLHFKDRMKHRLRRRGENISVWELEGLITRHPEIAECAVTAVPSELGEDDLKFVLAPKSGREFDPEEFRAWCRLEMARFMQPRYVEIVDQIPRLPTGKIDHQLIARPTDATVDFEADRR